MCNCASNYPSLEMMLLRSASTPMLKAQIPTINELAIVDVSAPKIPKIHSVNNLSTFYISNSSHSSTSSSNTRRLTRKTLESLFSDLLISREEDHKGTTTSTASGLLHDDCCRVNADALVADNEGCVGNGNGCGSGGYGSQGSSHSNSNDVNAYYRRMVQANPTSPLVLGNYAKYLKEVEGDVEKAQEYCERAIVVGGSGDGGGRDGDVLSLYAEIVWERSKDAPKAEAFFDRAVKAAPNDCYVMASYARFLWDAAEEEEDDSEVNNEEEAEQGEDDSMESVNRARPSLFLWPTSAAPAS